MLLCLFWRIKAINAVGMLKRRLLNLAKKCRELVSNSLKISKIFFLNSKLEEFLIKQKTTDGYIYTGVKKKVSVHVVDQLNLCRQIIVNNQFLKKKLR